MTAPLRPRRRPPFEMLLWDGRCSLGSAPAAASVTGVTVQAADTRHSVLPPVSPTRGSGQPGTARDTE